MQFSTVASIAAVAAVASAAANVTTATVSQESTTLVTITSCEDHVCSETVSPALVSTATVTVDDVITQYTTWCPLTTEAPKNGTSTAAPVTPTEAPKNTTSAAPTHSVTSYTGAAAKALPAAGALLAGAAALLL
ncbi:BFH_collapsed_G0036530.mRNA.1.CDS.1 [Saccharomyces cerevisiae]|nr:BGN_3a_G0035990.mRNA.1.CDS.1 [Saccharomyces cerevisiae]CAI5303033.1 BFH_HP2_G0035820.mRNA.1.CDS.1 [Saccharomyces cerevisiae]CAI6647729.1 BFH_HP2_G0035820.mRNA.1.CDS.1 [Saccharomyces cerevisiae]CAI6655316.1 ASN_HP1_G0035540.mRNA.1.CDS.1 [Saccharomyces cerevisiae]CAI6657646.1 BFH_HP1_G0035980.mRNA.1.CDS.1 [Saccharomyces cerevisiae]